MIKFTNNKIISCNQKYGLFACVNVGKITTILYIFFFVRFLLSILSKRRSLSHLYMKIGYYLDAPSILGVSFY